MIGFGPLCWPGQVWRREDTAVRSILDKKSWPAQLTEQREERNRGERKNNKISIVLYYYHEPGRDVYINQALT